MDRFRRLALVLAGALLPVLAATAAGAAGAAGADDAGASPQPGGPPEVLLQGDRSQVHALTIQRLRSQRDLAAVWAQLDVRTTRAQSPPAFDFSTGQLLAFFAGDQRTGGIEVSVRGIDVLPDRLGLRVRLSFAGPGCVVSTALTQPYQVVRIDRSLPERPLEFRYEFERRACAPGSGPIGPGPMGPRPPGRGG